jgi:acylglycerol lipase
VNADVLTGVSDDKRLAHLRINRIQSDMSVRSSSVVLCLHGIESHSGWFTQYAAATSTGGVDCVTYDRPGNGLSLNNVVQPLDEILSDLKSLITVLEGQYQHIFLLGMSWGGLLAAYAMQQGLITPRYAVLLVPGIYTRRPLPFTDFLSLIRNLLFFSEDEISIPIETDDFSTHEQIRNSINIDERRRKTAPARLLLATQKMRMSVRKAKMTKDSVEVWLAEHDRIVDNQRLIQNLERYGTPFQMFKGHGHALIFECPDKLSQMTIARIRSAGAL